MTTNLKTILKNEEFGKNYWDKFDFPGTQNVTCIFTTYNRCPFNPNTEKGKYNPLNWSIKSIFEQRPKVREIVVVDDASTDYTRIVSKILKKDAQEKGIIFRYIRHKINKGTPIGRNTGVKHATSDFVFFMDDDCIAFKYSVYGALKTYNEMQKIGLNVGVVQLPVYTLNINPLKTIKMNEIGRFDFAKGYSTTNFSFFPKEYLDEKRDIFIDKEKKLLRPIQIQFLIGVFLCSKKVYKNVGGFPTYINWKNAAAEEPEFGCRLLDNGYILFMQPDPKVGVFHGKFGYKTVIKFSQHDKTVTFNEKVIGNITLREIIRECRTPRENTGNRCSPEDWYYSYVIGRFIIFYKRNPLGALNWTKRIFDSFVIKNSKKISPPNKIQIATQEERQKIWYSAIVDGLKIISEKYLLEPFDFLKLLNSETGEIDSCQMDIFSEEKRII